MLQIDEDSNSIGEDLLQKIDEDLLQKIDEDLLHLLLLPFLQETTGSLALPYHANREANTPFAS
jgi:hypothetical protein